MAIKTLIVCDVCDSPITNTDTTFTVELKTPNQQPIVGRLEMCSKCYDKAKAHLEKEPKPTSFVGAKLVNIFK